MKKFHKIPLFLNDGFPNYLSVLLMSFQSLQTTQGRLGLVFLGKSAQNWPSFLGSKYPVESHGIVIFLL